MSNGEFTQTETYFLNGHCDAQHLDEMVQASKRTDVEQITLLAWED